MTNDSFLRPEFLDFLRLTAKNLDFHLRVAGKRQWKIGEALNKEWVNLTPELKAEITKEAFILECVYRLNENLSFPIACAETVNVWMKTAATYENMPNLELWKEELSFDHFVRAKRIAADPTNGIASPMEALSFAYENKWTAREMEQALTRKPDTDPIILELRMKYPKWTWPMLYALPGLNGTRQQAEYHLSEFIRLVTEAE